MILCKNAHYIPFNYIKTDYTGTKIYGIKWTLKIDSMAKKMIIRLFNVNLVQNSV